MSDALSYQSDGAFLGFFIDMILDLAPDILGLVRRLFVSENKVTLWESGRMLFFAVIFWQIILSFAGVL